MDRVAEDLVRRIRTEDVVGSREAMKMLRAALRRNPAQTTPLFDGLGTLDVCLDIAWSTSTGAEPARQEEEGSPTPANAPESQGPGDESLDAFRLEALLTAALFLLAHRTYVNQGTPMQLSMITLMGVMSTVADLAHSTFAKVASDSTLSVGNIADATTACEVVTLLLMTFSVPQHDHRASDESPSPDGEGDRAKMVLNGFMRHDTMQLLCKMLEKTASALNSDSAVVGHGAQRELEVAASYTILMLLEMHCMTLGSATTSSHTHLVKALLTHGTAWMTGALTAISPRDGAVKNSAAILGLVFALAELDRDTKSHVVEWTKGGQVDVAVLCGRLCALLRGLLPPHLAEDDESITANAHFDPNLLLQKCSPAIEAWLYVSRALFGLATCCMAALPPRRANAFLRELKSLPSAAVAHGIALYHALVKMFARLLCVDAPRSMRLELISADPTRPGTASNTIAASHVIAHGGTTSFQFKSTAMKDQPTPRLATALALSTAPLPDRSRFLKQPPPQLLRNMSPARGSNAGQQRSHHQSGLVTIYGTRFRTGLDSAHARSRVPFVLSEDEPGDMEEEEHTEGARIGPSRPLLLSHSASHTTSRVDVSLHQELLSHVSGLVCGACFKSTTETAQMALLDPSQESAAAFPSPGRAASRAPSPVRSPSRTKPRSTSQEETKEEPDPVHAALQRQLHRQAEENAKLREQLAKTEQQREELRQLCSTLRHEVDITQENVVLPLQDEVVMLREVLGDSLKALRLSKQTIEELKRDSVESEQRAMGQLERLQKLHIAMSVDL